MATLTIEDPELHERKTVDGQGRVYLGRAFAGEDVVITVERADASGE